MSESYQHESVGRTRSPLSLRIEARVLAGGLGARLGQDKGRVRLERRPLAGWAATAARAADLPVRILRRDAVTRCGPLGGILTALQASQADAILFLACDMPFVPASLLRRVVTSLRLKDAAVMMETAGGAGFPMLLRRATCLPAVAHQIENKEFSVQALAETLAARRIRPGERMLPMLMNINTPADLERAQAFARQLRGEKRKSI